MKAYKKVRKDRNKDSVTREREEKKKTKRERNKVSDHLKTKTDTQDLKMI